MILSQLKEARTHRNPSYKKSPTVDEETQKEIDFFNKMLLRSLPKETNPFLEGKPAYGVSSIYGFLTLPEVKETIEKYQEETGYAFSLSDLVRDSRFNYRIYFFDGEWYALLNAGVQYNKKVKGTPVELLRIVKEKTERAVAAAKDKIQEIDKMQSEKQAKVTRKTTKKK